MYTHAEKHKRFLIPVLSYNEIWNFTRKYWNQRYTSSWCRLQKNFIGYRLKKHSDDNDVHISDLLVQLTVQIDVRINLLSSSEVLLTTRHITSDSTWAPYT